MAGIRAQEEAVARPIATILPPESDEDVVVCRCERVALGPIRRAFRAGVRDLNQLKATLRTGMGACGAKTCASLLRGIARREGVAEDELTPLTHRPLVVEVPLGSFAGATAAPEGSGEGGGR